MERLPNGIPDVRPEPWDPVSRRAQLLMAAFAVGCPLSAAAAFLALRAWGVL